MLPRTLLTLGLVLTLLYCPWWLFLIVGAFGAYIFPYYGEFPLLAFVVDRLYSTSTDFSLLASNKTFLIALVFLIVCTYVKTLVIQKSTKNYV